MRQFPVTLQETTYGEDKLILQFVENAHFTGYLPADIFQVMYLERDPFLDEPGRGKSFNAVHTEHFPADNFKAALEHYERRKNSKHPAKSDRAYWHLSMFLKPDTQAKKGIVS